MEEGQLFIETGFDISGIDEAIDKISKKLKSGQRDLDALKNIQVEITGYISVLENKLGEITNLISDGTDGAKIRSDLIQTQVEHANSLGEKYVELNNLLSQTNDILHEIESSGQLNLSADGQGVFNEIESASESVTEAASQTSDAIENISNEIESIPEITETAEDLNNISEGANSAAQEISEMNTELENSASENIEMPDFSTAQSEAERLTQEIEAQTAEEQRINQELETERQRLSEIVDEASAVEEYLSNNGKNDLTNNSAIARYREQIEQQTSVVDALLSRLGEVQENLRELRERYDEVITHPLDIETEGTEEAEEEIRRIGGAADDSRKRLRTMVEYSKMIPNPLGAVANKVVSIFSKIGDSFHRVITRIKNMIFRFTVMRILYAAFDSLKNIMSAVTKQNSNLSNSFRVLKSNLLVAFYPVIELLEKGLERLVGWLLKATQFISGFIHAISGKDINDSIENAKKLYEAMNEEANAKAEKKQIDAKIKAKQREIKELEKQAKAIKKEYEAEKKAIEKKKDALDDEIDAVNKTIKALRRQESAEKKAAKALKESIQEQIDALKKRKKERKSELDAEKKNVSDQIKLVDDQIKALKKQKKAREEELKGEEKTLASFDTLQVLSGAEETDPEVKSIEKQIEALEEKKDALNDVKDAIPSDSEDPLIQQIEAEIESLEDQKDAIEEVDYSSLIQQQEDVIQGYRDQKNELDKVLDKLKEKYDFKITGIDEAKQAIQDAVTELQTLKTNIDTARAEAEKPIAFNYDTTGLEEAQKKGETVASFFKDKLFNKIWWLHGIGHIFHSLAEGYNDIATWWNKNVIEKIIGFFAWADSKIIEAWGDIYNDFISPLFVEPLQRLWEDIKTLWNDHIKQIFTKEFWVRQWKGIKDGFRASINWLLNVFETAINWIIEKLNLLHFDVPEWVPGIGGQTIGVELQKIEIPPLARGAVLPGGEPFLALVNDQPKGQTNVEAPLDTIKQGVAEVISQWNPQFTIVADASSSEFVRLLRIRIEDDKRRSSAFA